MKKVVEFGTCYDQEFSLEDEIDYNVIRKLQKLSHQKILFSGSTCMPRQQLPSWYDHMFDVSIPDWKNHKLCTFDETTDIRAKFMSELYSTKDIPILVYWSGGIDSTCIVSAIEKNFDKELKDRVHIMMNSNSYTENPYFFDKIIKPNYKYINSNTLNYTNSFILHGDPADALWLQGNILEYDNPKDLLQDDIHINDKNFRTLYLSKDFTNLEIDWYKNFYIEDAKLAGIKLNTTADLLWWSNFSLHLTQSSCKLLHSLDDYSTTNISLYKENALPWYLSDEYQVWSIYTQLENKKFDGTVRSYKMDAKKYIYDVDKNLYFRDYKTKVPSLSTEKNSKQFNFQVLYNDGTYDRCLNF